MPPGVPHMQDAFGNLQDRVRPNQTHNEIIDPVIARQPRQERPSLEERLHRLPGLAGERLAATHLLEYLIRFPLHNRGLFRRE